MNDQIIQIQSIEDRQHAVSLAASLLKKGELVALPTETVYGLAANALNPVAVAKIFTIKQRPNFNPVIVHVNSIDMAKTCITGWTEWAEKLAQAFWPGPLTLVLPKAASIPSIVTAGGSTVGVRWPQHPVMQEVISACGFPLAAPSANLSNSISPTTAEHVFASLGSAVPLIIDGGPCEIGIESTVIDLSQKPYRILRPGMLSEISLQTIIPDLVYYSEPGPSSAEHTVLKSPGLLSKHYAPKAKMALLQWTNWDELRTQIAPYRVSDHQIHLLTFEHSVPSDVFGRVRRMPHEPDAYAKCIYAELHACDAHQAELIIVEMPPRKTHWKGIINRLRRASGSH